MQGKKIGLVLVAVGIVLILAALGLALRNQQEDHAAGEQALQLFHQLQGLQRQQTPEESQSEAAVEDAALPVVEIDGYGYIGTLTIPALALELPVQDQWDYTRLKRSPCRQFGWPATGDFVIAAHNYTSHFKRLSKLEPGDTVQFEDMNGRVYAYTVSQLTTVQPEDVAAVQYSGYDLVLYTCTPGGRSRTAVYCSKAESAEAE